MIQRPTNDNMHQFLLNTVNIVDDHGHEGQFYQQVPKLGKNFLLNVTDNDH